MAWNGTGAAFVAASVVAGASAHEPSAIVINEVLYDPEGADGGLEFVEIAAVALADSAASLAGWVLETGNGETPGAWTVEWTGGVADRLVRGIFVIGEEAVEPAPHAVADLDLQNGPDACRLRGPAGEIDVLGWGEPLAVELREGSSAPDVSGLSLARLPDGFDTGDNASDFRAVVPSPGMPNAPEVGIVVESLRAEPPHLPAGQRVTFRWEIRNVGRTPYRGRVELRCQVHPGEILGAHVVEPAIAPGARGAFAVEVDPPPGTHQPRSDAMQLPIGVWPGAHGELRVSEAMSRPRAAEPEWIELVNDASAIVALDAFAIEDAAGTRFPLAGVLAPRERVIVTSDRAAFDAVWSVPGNVAVIEGRPWPALNQSAPAGVEAERVRLLVEEFDVDVAALPGGADEGTSWERTVLALPGSALENWGPSLDARGGTPGRVNSRNGDRPVPPGPAGSLAIVPAPFRPDHEPTALIALRTERPAAHCRIEIYDAEGRRVASLTPWSATEREHRALWDGRDTHGRRAPLGLYVVVATAGGTRPARAPLVVIR